VARDGSIPGGLSGFPPNPTLTGRLEGRNTSIERLLFTFPALWRSTIQAAVISLLVLDSSGHKAQNRPVAFQGAPKNYIRPVFTRIQLQILPPSKETRAMNQEVRQTYTELYKSFASPRDDAAWVRETIDQVASLFTKEKNLRLREDAKYFLLINFAEMIVHPLRERLQLERLKHDLSHDLKVLVNSAAYIGRAKEEISGHDIIDALSKNWTELDVMKLELWG
jgi:hypothetical protein